MTDVQFGDHEPVTVTNRAGRTQSPAEIFTRGLNLTGGSQWKFKFANGYGASVINDGYGGESGLYELAVLGPGGRITYDTPLTDDVLGWLTAEDVVRHLDEIEALAVNA